MGGNKLKYMNIIRYKLFESNKFKKYNDVLKKMNIMRGDNIDLTDITKKINDFLSKNDNKKKFLKNYVDRIKDDVEVKKEIFKAKKLKPSQGEIFLEHVLSRLVINDNEKEQILDGKLEDFNIFVSSDNHIIDGHHRWASAYILNPKCKIECTLIDMPIEYALPLINAIIEANGMGRDFINHSSKWNINLYDAIKWDKIKLMRKINSIIEKTLEKGMDYWKTNEKFSDIKIVLAESFYENIKNKLNLKKHPLKYLRKNLKKINKPKSFEKVTDLPKLKKKETKKLL